jgi:hypothetical protein
MDKPQPFRITSHNSKLLEAILIDLLKLGYTNQTHNSITTCISQHSDKLDDFEKSLDIFKKLNSNGSGNWYKYKDFTLPTQYLEALVFAKEQINHPYWTKDQFKVGDWVVLKDRAVIPENIGKITKITSYIYWGESWSNLESNLRLATTDEIQINLINEAKRIVENALSDGNFIYSQGKWAAIISSIPNVTILGYKAEIYDDRVQFGCQSYSKQFVLTLWDCLKTHNLKMDYKDEIEKIAEYYLNK